MHMDDSEESGNYLRYVILCVGLSSVLFTKRNLKKLWERDIPIKDTHTSVNLSCFRESSIWEGINLWTRAGHRFSRTHRQASSYLSNTQVLLAAELTYIFSMALSQRDIFAHPFFSFSDLSRFFDDFSGVSITNQSQNSQNNQVQQSAWSFRPRWVLHLFI